MKNLPSIPPSTVISGALLVGVFLAYNYLKKQFTTVAGAQAFANSHPNAAALAISLGFTAPGGQKPDTTGNTGAELSLSSQTTAVGNGTSQAYYDAVLQQYAYNDLDLSTSLDAQGTAGWPWTSYDAWVAAGRPTLPPDATAVVTVDSNGVFHNEYV